jgi:hypothetical protein
MGPGADGVLREFLFLFQLGLLYSRRRLAHGVGGVTERGLLGPQASRHTGERDGGHQGQMTKCAMGNGHVRSFSAGTREAQADTYVAAGRVSDLA